MNLQSITFTLLASLLLAACTSESQMAQNGTAPEGLYFAEPTHEGEVYESQHINFWVENVVQGLGVPWGMAFLPNGNVLITERDGHLRMVENGQLRDEPIAGTPDVNVRNQGGLLDIQLHPDYEDNGWIYMSFSKPGDGGTATSVIRAKLDGYELVDHEDIYTASHFASPGRHYGSRIVFDHDGYLFISVGDKGDMDTAQDINNSHGSLVRLYDDGSIPQDNPFVGEDGLDEIYSYGHRNIQGMGVHPQTGQIWTNEHGPRGGDELNHPEKGLNYGWPEITHGINYNGTVLTEDTAKAGMEQPVMHWTPSIAPSGLAFVTGDRYPEWEGSIINGALKFQLLSRIEIDGNEFSNEERLIEGIGRIRVVTMAPDGYLYFSNESDGVISRIVPVVE